MHPFIHLKEMVGLIYPDSIMHLDLFREVLFSIATTSVGEEASGGSSCFASPGQHDVDVEERQLTLLMSWSSQKSLLKQHLWSRANYTLSGLITPLPVRSLVL